MGSVDCFSFFLLRTPKSPLVEASQATAGTASVHSDCHSPCRRRSKQPKPHLSSALRPAVRLLPRAISANAVLTILWTTVNHGGRRRTQPGKPVMRCAWGAASLVRS